MELHCATFSRLLLPRLNSTKVLIHPGRLDYRLKVLLLLLDFKKTHKNPSINYFLMKTSNLLLLTMILV